MGEFWRSSWIRNIPRLRRPWKGKIGFLAITLPFASFCWRYLTKPLYQALSAYANWEFLKTKVPAFGKELAEFDIVAYVATIAGTNVVMVGLFLVGCIFLFLASRELRDVETQLAEDLVNEPLVTNPPPISIRPRANAYGIRRDDPVVVARAAALLSEQIFTWAEDWESMRAIEAGAMDPFTALARGASRYSSIETDLDFHAKFGGKLELVSKYIPLLAVGYGAAEMTPDRARRIAQELRAFSYGLH